MTTRSHIPVMYKKKYNNCENCINDQAIFLIYHGSIDSRRKKIFGTLRAVPADSRRNLSAHDLIYRVQLKKVAHPQARKQIRTHRYAILYHIRWGGCSRAKPFRTGGFYS